MQGHDGEVTSIAFSPNGRQLATGSRDWKACVWDLSTGKQSVVLEVGVRAGEGIAPHFVHTFMGGAPLEGGETFSSWRRGGTVCGGGGGQRTVGCVMQVFVWGRVGGGGH